MFAVKWVYDGFHILNLFQMLIRYDILLWWELTLFITSMSSAVCGGCCVQVTLEITTMGRVIQWSHSAYECATTCSLIMGFIAKWKYMWVLSLCLVVWKFSYKAMWILVWIVFCRMLHSCIAHGRLCGNFR